MNAYMHVCMKVGMYGGRLVRMGVGGYVFPYVGMYVCIPPPGGRYVVVCGMYLDRCVYIYTCICMNADMHVCMKVGMQVGRLVRMDLGGYIYIYVYM